MKFYISGPMRNHPSFNFPAFDRAQELLEANGHTCFNPAAHDRTIYPDIESWDGFASGDTALCPKFDLPSSLAWDFASILEADAIVLLPGWEASSGAKAERFVAEAVGKLVLLYKKGVSGAYYLEADSVHRMAYPTFKETV